MPDNLYSIIVDLFYQAYSIVDLLLLLELFQTYFWTYLKTSIRSILEDQKM